MASTSSPKLPSAQNTITPAFLSIKMKPKQASNPQKLSQNGIPLERLILEHLSTPKAFRAKHQSELAMPSPASTPGTERLSDVSSSCSVEDTDSNKSSPPGSPASNSFSTPVSELRKKYKNELWSAIRSDYRYLMDGEIIETCRSTESDLSFESDDQMTGVRDISFKDYMKQYTELNNWLGSVLQRTQRQCHCLSEKYVNQTFHEDMLNHLTSLKHFKELAKQLIFSCPHLKDDISQHLKEVNGKWEALGKLLLPNAKYSDKKTMLHDMEVDFDGLRQWVDDMEIRCRNWRLHSHWTNEDIEKQLENQKALQAQIESHSKVVRALLSLCDRLTNDGSEESDGGNACSEEQEKAFQLQKQVTEIQKEYHSIWLRSLEWQMTLEDARANGIHLRHELEDDQWDAMRSTGQRKQKSELPTLHEDASDKISNKDSLFARKSSSVKKAGSKNEIDEYENSDDIIEESFSDGGAEDFDASSDNCDQAVPLSSSGRRSYSDPVLNTDARSEVLLHQSYLGKGGKGVSGLRSGLQVIVNPPVGKQENEFSREWSPGKLKRYGAVDLRAAFDEENKEHPAVDVGYSSGSHSNEETESSMRQGVVVCPSSQNQKQSGQFGGSLNLLNPVAAAEDGGFQRVETGEGKDAYVVFERKHLGTCFNQADSIPSLPRSASDTTKGFAEHPAELLDDLRNIPETEDEMSLELPLDDVPVVRSSDLLAEDNCGPFLQKTAIRRSLRFAEETSLTDLDSWPISKVNAQHKISPKKKSGNGRYEYFPRMVSGQLAVHGTVDEVKKAAKSFCNSASHSGSCYASSEGTESESDLVDLSVPMKNQEVKFGCQLKWKWNGCSSLRSSPVKDVTEAGSSRSPLKRRMSETLENVFDDGWRDVGKNQRWVSDSAICQRLRDDFISPKIPKISSHSSELAVRSSLKAFCGFVQSDEFSRKKRNGILSHGRLKKPSQTAPTGGFTELNDQVVPSSAEDISMFLRQGDAVVPVCNSLNSSLTELTADESLMFSDNEKIGDEEIHWQEDDCYRDERGRGDSFGIMGDRFTYDVHSMSHDLALPSYSWTDSDSDMEDFHHVLQESRKGLKFIEVTIRQDFGFGENDNSKQPDPVAFNEPLATCKTNIVCLQELIDALRSKNKMDNEIQQVSEIVTRWQQLQHNLLLLQSEAQHAFDLQAEVAGLRLTLQNLAAEINFDKFDNVSQLEEALRTVRGVEFEITQNTGVRLATLERALRQFRSDRSELDPQATSFDEQFEQLKIVSSALLKRCESDGQNLQLALFSWYRFREKEKELKCLLEQHHLVSNGSAVPQTEAESSAADGGVELMQTNWILLDETLQQLSSSYLDFVSLCSNPAKQVLKEAITASSSQLQLLRRKNDEKIVKLIETRKESSSADTRGRQAAVSHPQRASDCLLTTEDALPKSASHPVKYVLPVALAFVLVSCLYGLFGDSWYELLGSLGLILDPNLQHIKGPPPS